MVILGRRKELTPLFLMAALGMVALALICLASLPAEPPAWERVQSYFPEGPVRLAVQAVAALSLAALLLTAVELAASLIRPSRRIGVLRADGQSIEQTIDEVRAQVERFMNPRTLDVSRSLDVLLRGGMVLHASDIHLNPVSEGLKVTYRVDGVLYDVLQVQPEFAPRLSQRVKVLARLDTFAKTPQDGVLRRRVGDIDIEARVSSLPANHGERVVLRLVRGGEAVRALAELGFEPTLQARLESALEKPQGLLFVSGPVGSGKTTTLYSALQHLHHVRGETTSLMTLEDPIELQLPFATQTQINSKVGMSFAQTLRSILRQDPGALMVGEIRDRETAEIAGQAGLTGHLILTTVHVQSAAGTFARLMEMGVEPFVLASSTVGSLAQRLVRGLCTECRTMHQPTSTEIARFTEMGIGIGAGEFFSPVGCDACEGRGFDRRLPIAEMLVVTESISNAITQRLPTEELHRLAIAEGMVPLAKHGLDRASRGETSLAEVLRVAG